MNSYAPIAMPAAAGTTYAPAPVPFTGPAPSTYGATPMMTNGPPIPLTQVLLPSDMLTEEASGVGAGGGGDVTKILALPLLFLLPVFLVVVVVVVVAGGGGGGGGGGFLRRLFGFPPKFQQYEETTPYYDYNGQRKKRTVDSSSGLPVMSLAQVERTTEVVFAAMGSQECIQRILCEVGSLSKSYSDTAHSAKAKAVEQFVPESIKESYDVFTKANNCEQYRCGLLKVKT